MAWRTSAACSASEIRCDSLTIPVPIHQLWLSCNRSYGQRRVCGMQRNNCVPENDQNWLCQHPSDLGGNLPRWCQIRCIYTCPSKRLQTCESIATDGSDMPWLVVFVPSLATGPQFALWRCWFHSVLVFVAIASSIIGRDNRTFTCNYELWSI